MTEPSTHVVIPDTQVKPGVPIDNLFWIGQYIADHFAGKDRVRLIHLGDHADMPSLSSYDKGTRAMEGKRYVDDIAAANYGFDMLCGPFEETGWEPLSRDFLLGNHEDRITRATNADAQLEGALSLNDLNYSSHGWKVHPFLKPVTIDGIVYAHYFCAPLTGRPYSGAALGRLKTLGHSFTMGHQQTLDVAVRFVNGKQQRALVCGAAYLHDEDYMGPQGNAAHWRGILVCHQVRDGSYDLMEVSLNYLCQRYEGMSLAKFMRKRQFTVA